MIQLTWLDILASALWAVGTALLLMGVVDDHARTTYVAMLPLTAAATMTVIAWMRRFLMPIRQSMELAGAVVRLNGHSRERSPV